MKNDLSAPSEQYEDEERRGTDSPVSQYLKQAASPMIDTHSPRFEFEVVDRKRATADQWNTIGAYLSRNRRSQIEELKDEEGGILVDWEGGQAFQSPSEAELNVLLDKLAGEEDGKSKTEGWRSWFS